MWAWAEMAGKIKEASESVVSTRRPWRVFLDVSGMNLPRSISEGSRRVAQNLTYFLLNYGLVLLVVFLLTLLRHPLSLFLFILLLAAWYFLYFSRDDLPLALIPLALLTLLALFATAAWLNLLLSAAIASVLVFFHSALRRTDDLVADDQENPYGPMLSHSPAPAAGAYVPV
ncbi:hypothetical protein VNO78_20166 [Psophocarpus tetragonolobus]|uniref:PRA1 family protein n=1 Tax=Psophocarpus tetragonolobus TaxID=3891 RepID=A0AAN9SAT9_PSOTE